MREGQDGGTTVSCPSPTTATHLPSPLNFWLLTVTPNTKTGMWTGPGQRCSTSRHVPRVTFGLQQLVLEAGLVLVEGDHSVLDHTRAAQLLFLTKELGELRGLPLGA